MAQMDRDAIIAHIKALHTNSTNTLQVCRAQRLSCAQVNNEDGLEAMAKAIWSESGRLSVLSGLLLAIETNGFKDTPSETVLPNGLTLSENAKEVADLSGSFASGGEPPLVPGHAVGCKCHECGAEWEKTNLGG